jgi:lipoyl(octanoyl) transferase
VEIRELGRVEYTEALALQERLRAQRQADATGDVLLLLEHDPVYTRGRRSGPGDVPAAVGIPVVDVNRGGKVTYHGPGQLVGYPIMRVTDVPAFVRSMEETIIAALATAGVEGRTRCHEGAEFTGVWVEDRKIASIGVHLSRGVTMHGFAVNVCGDLAPWSWITPCGMPGVAMTSVERETGRADLDGFRRAIAEAWSQRLLSIA